MSEDRKFYLCECEEDAISVSDWSDGGEPLIGISLWTIGPKPYHRTLRSKLRHIWHIIKFGHPWLDHILLDQDTAIGFVNELNSLMNNKPGQKSPLR